MVKLLAGQLRHGTPAQATEPEAAYGSSSIMKLPTGTGAVN